MVASSRQEMAYSLEPFLIPIAEWNKSEIARIIPEDVRDGITDDIRNGCPVGVGCREDVGYFVLGTGQGPFIIWIENEEGYDPGLNRGRVLWKP
jgi:hypothetical protein